MSSLIGDSWILMSVLHSICCGILHYVASEKLHCILRRVNKASYFLVYYQNSFNVGGSTERISEIPTMEIFTFILMATLSLKTDEEAEGSSGMEDSHQGSCCGHKQGWDLFSAGWWPGGSQATTCPFISSHSS